MIMGGRVTLVAPEIRGKWWDFLTIGVLTYGCLLWLAGAMRENRYIVQRPGRN